MRPGRSTHTQHAGVQTASRCTLKFCVRVEVLLRAATLPAQPAARIRKQAPSRFQGRTISSITFPPHQFGGAVAPPPQTNEPLY